MTVLVALVSIALLGVVLPMSIYLQSVLGMSALQAGLTLAPSPLVSLWVSPLAGRLCDRIGGRRILFTGLLAYAAGIVAIGVLAGTGSHWYTFTAALVVMGFGVGCMIAPLATEAMRNVPPRLAGAASGVNNTVRQIGSVIGSAVVGAVMQSRLAAELASGASYADGFVATLHVTFALPVAVLVLGAAACALVKNPVKRASA